MIKKFNEKMTSLAYERIEEVGKVIISNEEYRSVGSQISGLFDEIKDALPEDKKKLIDLFDEESTTQSNIYLEWVYKQGLKDGLDMYRCI